jgi:hypothetical protein
MSDREAMFAILDDCSRRTRCERVEGLLVMTAAPPTGGITLQQVGVFEPMQFQAELLAMLRRTDPLMSPICDAAVSIMLGRVEGLCVLTAGPRGWEIRRSGKQHGLMVDHMRGAA